MGEMADFYMDQAVENGWIGGHSGKPPTCNRCGARFDWHNTGVRWVPMNLDGSLHKCGRVSTPGTFKPLEADDE